MTNAHSIILGILQGIGEFLPISSSAHLALAPYLLGWNYQGLSYDIMLHAGTLLAILVYFAKEWLSLIKAGLTAPKSEPGKLFWQLVAGSIPAAVLGVLLNDKAEYIFRAPAWIAFNLIFFSIWIYLADRNAKQNKELTALTYKDVLLIGFAQALALMPGASRSGMTIMAALFLGYRRPEAAKLSFLLATPIIFGAGLMASRHLTAADLNITFALGLTAAFLSGLAAISFLLKRLQTRDLKPFLVYRVILGVLILWSVFK